MPQLPHVVCGGSWAQRNRRAWSQELSLRLYPASAHGGSRGIGLPGVSDGQVAPNPTPSRVSARPGRSAAGPLVPLLSSGRSLTSAPSSVSCICCLSALLAPPAQPGRPPLLSLLLCAVPSKAVHLTYEPAWQLPPGERPAAPTSATSLSCSRQVMAPEGRPPPRPPSIPLPHSLCMHPKRPMFPPVCACLHVRGLVCLWGPSSSSSWRRRRSSP